MVEGHAGEFAEGDGEQREVDSGQREAKAETMGVVRDAKAGSRPMVIARVFGAGESYNRVEDGARKRGCSDRRRADFARAFICRRGLHRVRFLAAAHDAGLDVLEVRYL